MSLDTVLARISALDAAIAGRPTPPVPAAADPAAFRSVLARASTAPVPGATGALAGLARAELASPSTLGAGAGGRLVGLAAGELGQAEQPPGSNASPRIAQYRSATAGAGGPAPWCAYFVSWVARQAGVPVGERGQGFGSVDALWSWAQRAGRSAPAGADPRPGDLAVFNQHIGIVESVEPNGRLHTIEGNYSNRVARVTRQRNEVVGFVRMS